MNKIVYDYVAAFLYFKANYVCMYIVKNYRGYFTERSLFLLLMDFPRSLLQKNSLSSINCKIPSRLIKMRKVSNFEGLHHSI